MTNQSVHWTATWFGCLTLASVFVLSTGCQQAGAPENATATAQRAETSPRPTPVGPFDLRLSENERLGEVAYVALDDRQVVLRADPDTGFPSRGILITRAEDFTPTAIIELAGIAEGAAAGARILWGQPNTGDEVVAPGPELRAWGNSTLDRAENDQ